MRETLDSGLVAWGVWTLPLGACWRRLRSRRGGLWGLRGGEWDAEEGVGGDDVFVGAVGGVDVVALSAGFA